jgi:hypothetical protein
LVELIEIYISFWYFFYRATLVGDQEEKSKWKETEKTEL